MVLEIVDKGRADRGRFEKRAAEEDLREIGRGLGKATKAQ